MGFPFPSTIAGNRPTTVPDSGCAHFDKLQFQVTAGGRVEFMHSNRIFREDVENSRRYVSFFSYPVESRHYAVWPERPEGWRTVVD
ncbi:hypothetical protein EJ110_NYTH37003 [Nymphaea thermarum]|nr:hypothetical protein EJ110_NYTH37003 [Nymphaea thermarum]